MSGTPETPIARESLVVGGGTTLNPIQDASDPRLSSRAHCGCVATVQPPYLGVGSTAFGVGVVR